MFHKYVFGDVPPVAVTVADPSLPPKQLTWVVEVVAVSKAGCVIVTVAVEEHPLSSVTVKL